MTEWGDLAVSDAGQTKRKIKDVLLNLMIDTDADKISAAELTRKAEISRATFYRYYDSVDAVLCEITDEFLEGMRDRHRYFIPTPIDFKKLDVPQDVFLSIAKYLLENKTVFLAMTGPHGDPRFAFKWHALFKEFNYGKLVYEGLAKKDLDIYMEFILAGNDAVIRYWLTQKPEIRPEEGAPIMQRILYGPFVCG